jgi:hypothetical protein
MQRSVTGDKATHELDDGQSGFPSRSDSGHGNGDGVGVFWMRRIIRKREHAGGNLGCGNVGRGDFDCDHCAGHDRRHHCAGHDRDHTRTPRCDCLARSDFALRIDLRGLTGQWPRGRLSHTYGIGD